MKDAMDKLNSELFSVSRRSVNIRSGSWIASWALIGVPIVGTFFGATPIEWLSLLAPLAISVSMANIIWLTMFENQRLRIEFLREIVELVLCKKNLSADDRAELAERIIDRKTKRFYEVKGSPRG